MDSFTNTLLTWYRKNRRSYPWRKERSPYKIMIAEFMLQRTRADQVLPVYLEFIKKFPDIHNLSLADENDIRDTLKPLGLYWRATHFKKAANYIINEYGGNIPSSKDELQKIPGIGDYVAGAILAVSYSKSTNIVDSNIARVLNRYYGLNLTGEIRRNKKINELSGSIFSEGNPKLILFAIIDFSAVICTSLNPHHDICPMKNQCIYYQNMLNC